MIPSIWRPSKLPKPQSRCLVYFLCGNPGRIEYYADFLDGLRAMLDETEEKTAFDIFGRNLLGFSDDADDDGALWDLEAQINMAAADVEARAETYDRVILTGHSIGAYIAVEVIHRSSSSSTTTSSQSTPHLHGILLFPTIASLAQSRSGRRIQQLRRVPAFTSYAPSVGRTLARVVPERVLRWLVERFMGFSTRAAAVTASWLRSERGLAQTLALGLSELDTFILGCQERERKGGGSVVVEVDGGRLPHAFCTTEQNSWLVAKTVHGWIRDVERGC
ncbi:hypothetical protein CP532_2187 [Ophiocordyceps camponoti-leonardi (nom. inval.)]|nr:hypothetical protein CP532_2187 [Ophiocordyceps camponoti-leonardi (nom. inval.)]